MQNKYLEQYDDLYGEDMHLVKMPLLSQEVRGLELLRQYGAMLLQPYQPDAPLGYDPFKRIEQLEAEVAQLKSCQ
jgi:anion-transporting  ArsA/GET3 family ATPase